MSFREMLLRQRVNEGARACMLSHGSGTNLDNLAGNMNTKRLVITPATDTTDAVMESDTSLRLRAQRAYDGLSVAGPSGAYEYFARSASGLVRDARAISPSPACVTVSILSTEGDGTATEALLNTVRAVLNAEDTRPVADRLTVQSASIVTWRLNANCTFTPARNPNLFWLRLNRRSGSGWLSRGLLVRTWRCQPLLPHFMCTACNAWR